MKIEELQSSLEAHELMVIDREKGMIMHQQKYVLEILDRFGLIECKSISNPCETSSKLEECSEEEKVDATMYKQLVGSLRYLCNSRPDICYAVGVISRFMNEPRKSHLIAAKRILRYVKGTANYVTALSSCEAEYIAGTYAACQLVWLESLCLELKCKLQKPQKLLIDNRSAINLAKNPVSHGRSKHIETRFHFIREQVMSGRIELVYCPTQDQLADGFTKALKLDRFEELRRKLGL
ncbi:Copia protein, partial [Glycine soja]